MRASIAIVLLCVALGACGGPAPTATPDVTTPAGYRLVITTRAQNVTDIVTTTNSTCSRAPIAECIKVLNEQTPRFTQESDWILTTKFPQGCLPLFSGYAGLMQNAQSYFDTVRARTSQNDQAALNQAAAEHYAGFTKGKASTDSFLPNDPCR